MPTYPYAFPKVDPEKLKRMQVPAREPDSLASLTDEEVRLLAGEPESERLEEPEEGPAP